MSGIATHDPHFGSTHAVSAIDLAVQAKALSRVGVRVKPNYPEARRLYEIAIKEAKIAIEDLAGDPRYPGVCEHLRVQISQWEGILYSMPHKGECAWEQPGYTDEPEPAAH